MRRMWVFVITCLVMTTMVTAPAVAARELPFAADADRTWTGPTEPHEDCPAGWVGEEAGYEGRATHLGRVVLYELLCLDFISAAPDIVFTVDGELVAANGDHLTFRVEGAVIDGAMTGTGWVFTGGTGRFASASGEADEVTLIRDGDGLIIGVTATGSISYDASDRAD